MFASGVFEAFKWNFSHSNILRTMIRIYIYILHIYIYILYFLLFKHFRFCCLVFGLFVYVCFACFLFRPVGPKKEAMSLKGKKRIFGFRQVGLRLMPRAFLVFMQCSWGFVR